MRKQSLVLLVILVVTAFVAVNNVSLVHATTYTYTFSGPYYIYNGEVVPNFNLSIAFLYPNGTIQKNYLNSTGSAGSLTVSSSNPLYQMIWNPSTPNFTMVYNFLPSDIGATINVYIPATLSPNYIYTFDITDFFGMNNSYIQDAISTTGSTWKTVERNWLNTTSSPSFTMPQFATFQITIGCDQGTYTQMFLAGTTFTTSIPILSGMFPTANYSTPTLDAVRINATAVGISYIDPSNLTDWLAFNITHKSGTTTILDYSYNETGNTQTIVWADADPYVDYTVTAEASINAIPYYYIAQAFYSGASNPFLGIFDYLSSHEDTIPHNVASGWVNATGGQMTSAQIAESIGAVIVMLFLCIGSFRSAGACCILSWAIFGVLVYLGWMGVVTPWTIPQFAFAGFFGILVHLDESRQQTRID